MVNDDVAQLSAVQVASISFKRKKHNYERLIMCKLMVARSHISLLFLIFTAAVTLNSPSVQPSLNIFMPSILVNLF